MDNTDIILKRTDSETLIGYKNKCYVVMSQMKMLEKIKLIEEDLKKKIKYNNK